MKKNCICFISAQYLYCFSLMTFFSTWKLCPAKQSIVNVSICNQKKDDCKKRFLLINQSTNRSKVFQKKKEQIFFPVFFLKYFNLSFFFFF